MCVCVCGMEWKSSLLMWKTMEKFWACEQPISYDTSKNLNIQSYIILYDISQANTSHDFFLVFLLGYSGYTSQQLSMIFSSELYQNLARELFYWIQYIRLNRSHCYVLSSGCNTAILPLSLFPIPFYLFFHWVFNFERCIPWHCDSSFSIFHCIRLTAIKSFLFISCKVSHHGLSF